MSAAIPGHALGKQGEIKTVSLQTKHTCSLRCSLNWLNGRGKENSF